MWPLVVFFFFLSLFFISYYLMKNALNWKNELNV